MRNRHVFGQTFTSEQVSELNGYLAKASASQRIGKSPAAYTGLRPIKSVSFQSQGKGSYKGKETQDFVTCTIIGEPNYLGEVDIVAVGVSKRNIKDRPSTYKGRRLAFRRAKEAYISQARAARQPSGNEGPKGTNGIPLNVTRQEIQPPVSKLTV